MPVQYTSIVDEHHAVRRAAGIFDISHMGEVWVQGPRADAFLNSVLTNDVRKLGVGEAQYTLMCRDDGGVVDDLYVYRTTAQAYLLVINASRADVDVAWLQSRLALFPGGGAEVLDASAELAAVAVQGPAVATFIASVFPGASTGGKAVASVVDLRKNEVGRWAFGGMDAWVARTGYTGEDGFEVVVPAGGAEPVWRRLLEAGRPHGLIPAGLGARDTLRTEMGYPLYGHELDEATTPIEAGLGFFVGWDKGEFAGRCVLAQQKAEGGRRKCVAFRMTGRSAPPRPGYAVWSGGEKVGVVVSGTQSPSLGAGIGMAYVPPGLATPGTVLEVEIRGTRHPAEVARKPLYKK